MHVACNNYFVFILVQFVTSKLVSQSPRTILKCLSDSENGLTRIMLSLIISQIEHLY